MYGLCCTARRVHVGEQTFAARQSRFQRWTGPGAYALNASVTALGPVLVLGSMLVLGWLVALPCAPFSA